MPASRSSDSTARPTERVPFEGFPAEAFEFYAALAENNTRPWWQEHKSRYESEVRGPLVAMLSELSAEFGTPHVFRPYRDSRFSKDKTPVKDHQGGVIEVEDAIAYYVQVSASGLLVAGGWYAPAGQQVARFRESVVGPPGAELERILRGFGGARALSASMGSAPTPRSTTGRASTRSTWQVDGQPLKTQPRGFPADHPRIDLLRCRRLAVSRTFEVAPWLGTRKALTTVRTQWRAIRPLIEWLADYVGPATDPADEP